jgi:hypothetical protein
MPHHFTNYASLSLAHIVPFVQDPDNGRLIAMDPMLIPATDPITVVPDLDETIRAFLFSPLTLSVNPLMSKEDYRLTTTLLHSLSHHKEKEMLYFPRGKHMKWGDFLGSEAFQESQLSIQHFAQNFSSLPSTTTPIILPRSYENRLAIPFPYKEMYMRTLQIG